MHFKLQPILALIYEHSLPHKCPSFLAKQIHSPLCSIGKTQKILQPSKFWYEHALLHIWLSFAILQIQGGEWSIDLSHYTLQLFMELISL